MQIIAAPPAEQSLYGLFSLPDVVDRTNEERWADGARYESLACRATVKNVDICDNTKQSVISTRAAQSGERIQRGFGVNVVDTCTTFGFSAREREGMALNQLELCTQKAVEREFFTGALATLAGYTDNRRLAGTGATNVTPGGVGVKVRYGLALLEKALADTGCGNRGVIHVTRDVGSVLPTRMLDDHLETFLGNYVVAGSGYTGTGPSGQAVTATSTWIYATGMVKVMLGEAVVLGENLAQRTNLSINTIETYAQRAAWVDFDSCAWFAVQIDLSADLA